MSFLRHVQIGMGGGGRTNPVVQDDEQQPAGSRITLVFPKYTPDVTPAQIKALLAPLVSFDVKTPVQAYTDTAAAEAEGSDSESSRDGGHEHGYGDLRDGGSGVEIA